MLSKIKKTQSEGFTIIEVMIVLAIAALILLIVLLAVPALQRNSRNTALKNDASAIVAGVSEFASNNDGQIPTPGGSSQSGTNITLNNASGASVTTKVQGSTSVGFSAAPTQAGQIKVLFGSKCNAPNSFGVTANTRSTAILYPTEGTGGSLAQHCIDG